MTRYQCGALAVLLGISCSVLAVMPPHVNRSVPANGGVLHGDTVILHGYTLDSGTLQRSTTVTDLTTKQPLRFTATVSCQSVGQCGRNSAPGSCQYQCVGKIKLYNIVKDRRYQLRVMRHTVTFSAHQTITDPPRPRPSK